MGNKTYLTFVLFITLAFVACGGGGGGGGPVNPTGTFDASFSSDGIATEAGLNSINKIYVTSGGTVYVAGDVESGQNPDAATAKYTTSGIPDINFADGLALYNGTADLGDDAAALTMQSDGKMLVAGLVINDVTNQDDNLLLMRYNTNGTLDDTFGEGGVIIWDGGLGTPDNDEATAVAVQSDGRILVAGLTVNANGDDDVLLMRYNANGTPDTLFNGVGWTIWDRGVTDNDTASAIKIQSDGMILVAGTSRNAAGGREVLVLRYKTDGTLDTTFDTDGVMTWTSGIGAPRDTASDIDMYGSSILVAGTSQNVAGDRDGLLLKLDSTGALDATFDTDGIVTWDRGLTVPDDDNFSALHVLGNGSILVAGNAMNDDATKPNRDLLLIKYDMNGQPDLTFATDGLFIWDSGKRQNDTARDLGVMRGGKIFIGGSGGGTALLMKVLSDGSALDDTYGGGVATVDGGSDDRGHAVAIQSDGKAVVTGYMNNAIDDDILVARYNTDGTLDTLFNAAGWTIWDSATGNDHGNAIAIQPDGKILVAGVTDNSADNDVLVIRYNADGTLDTTFNTTGIFTLDVATSNDAATAVAVQDDGMIVVSGYTDTDVLVLRLDSTGALDATFGAAGIKVWDSGFTDYALDMVIQDDGMIVIAGEATTASNGTDVLVLRLDATGAEDMLFNSMGWLTWDRGITDDEFGTSVALQSDGKIVVGGYAWDAVSNDNFVLVVFNADGTLDTTFNTTGSMVWDGGNGEMDNVSAVAIERDGKILVAGYSSSTIFKDSDAVIYRFETDGTLDITFEADGIFNYDTGNDDYATDIAISSRTAYITGWTGSADDNLFLMKLK